nr:hypothetical protein [Tanacetum cinerariifolium]
MHKAFPLPGESSHWQYKFPLPVEGVPTARRMEIPLPGVCTAMMKKLPVEHKDTKTSNKMYYPRFTKVIIHHFMSKDPSISRRNKFGALLPIELTNEDIRNSNAYKEYYAVATGATPPKPKASVWKTRSISNTAITPPTTVADEGTGTLPGFPNVPTYEFEEEISWKSTDDEGDDDDGNDGGGDDDDGDDKDDDGEEEETRAGESFDPILKTLKNSNNEGNGKENLGINVGREEGHDEEGDEDELYRDVNINQGRGIQTTQEFEDSHVTLTLVNPDGQQQSSSVSSQFVTNNDEFLKTIDENMQKIINEQVKEQVKVQVSKILPKIEQNVNEHLEAKVLNRSSNSSNTSYVVAAELSEMELKKILIEKMEGNKSIHRFNEQRNLYKALVDAYESDKIILDTYGDIVTLKRRRDDDAHKDKEPSARPDRRSKRRKEGKEPEVDTLTLEFLAGPTYKLMKGSCKSLVELEYQLEEVYKATTDQLDLVNPEGQQYPHNLLKPLPLIPNNWGRRVIAFDHFINNDLKYLCGGALSRKYTTFVTKTKAADYGYIKWIKDLESARDVYSKRRIIAVTELKIVEWHNYKHLDWITVRRDDDKLYKFKEGDFKRLGIQDIEDMLLLLHRHPKACGRPSAQCQKLPEEAQPNKAGYVPDGTLTDVHTALDDRLKGIQMKYLPQSIWRKNDKDRAAFVIQAIDKRLKTMRIMRSLERFVGGRLYEGDLMMLQRTI